MSWLKRLKSGLSKSSKKLSDGLTSILHLRKLDEETLQNLEDLLIQSDLGTSVTSDVIEKLRVDKFDTQINIDEIKYFLAKELTNRLKPYVKPLEINKNFRPEIILIVGVNGSGKTTTIAKLGDFWSKEKKSIRFAAGDTFRAAAVEQLCIWGKRLDIPVIKRGSGADAAALAYDAVIESQIEKDDVLLIDTAGRLHTNSNLMEELKKIKRVIKKAEETAPHKVILVLDATVGQNAYKQVEIFHKAVGLTGLIMTKLDGTAKGGVLVGLADRFKLPIFAIGIGEKANDLQQFEASDFANSLVGLES